MFKYRLDIAYDGKDFSGSQVQPEGRTVEGELRQQLSRLCKFEDLTFSGRTDAGVHARQQVVSFLSSISNEEQFSSSLRRMLPVDIYLRNFKKTTKNFDARYSARSRTYIYFLKNINKSIPTDRHTKLLIDKELDLFRLNQATQYFIGENDFQNFSKGDKRRNTVRKITKANWKESNNLYRFSISGESYLWQMVRNIVGSLLALNSNKINEGDIKNYLNQKGLGRIPYVAPPEGLHLWKIEY